MSLMVHDDEYLNDKIQNLQFIQIYIMYRQTHEQKTKSNDDI